MNIKISYDSDQLANFCKENKIRKLAFFGSVIREDFGPDSDVDVLVEFEEGAVIGWNIVIIIEDLAEIFKRKVDLVTYASLKGRFKEIVIKENMIVYEKEAA